MKTTRVLSIDVGIVNLAYCITDFHESDTETLFDLVHVEKVQIGTMKQKAHVLVESAVDFFRESEVINDKPIDYIFIEQQLSRAIKNCILAYSILTYFYTESRIAMSSTSMSFVAPRKKFTAVRAALENTDCLDDVDFDKVGSRELKKLSIEVARKVFTRFGVDTGLRALDLYKPKLDDVCDVFLQSFSVFLEDGCRGLDGNPLRGGRRRSQN